MTKKLFSFFALLLIFFFARGAFGQITIAPIMLFMDQQERFGTVLVMNGSEQIQEISMEFPFGYPVTDKEGDVNMVYDDSAVAEKWGISDAIRGFPTNFTLQPGQRQVVRLTVRPKQDFRDGMYWSRIRTTSTPQAPAIGEAEDEEITTQITYKFEQVTAVFYKHGEVNTGIEVRDFKTNHSSEDTLSFIVDVERTGNAPFLGSIILNVVDSQGNTIIEKRTSTSIYFDYRQVFEVSKSGLEQKDYSAEIRFISQRPDVPKSDLVQMEPVTRVINFSLK